MDAKYNIKWFLFSAFSNVHTKAIRNGSCQRHQKEYRTKGSEADPPSEIPLERIVFAAEFIENDKLGPFCSYGHFVGCRSPPLQSVFDFSKQIGGKGFEKISGQ